MSDDERPFYAPNGPRTPSRQPQRGELLFEFYLERDHTRWLCELRQHPRAVWRRGAVLQKRGVQQ
jgi:hypothetical protein